MYTNWIFTLKISEPLFFFFFFQAEDGIRDIGVTGVQTCALPISRSSTAAPDSRARGRHPPRRRHPRVDAGLASGDPDDRHRHAGPRPRLVRASVGLDRKSGVEGKSVDLGGRRIIKKKKNI